LSFRTSALCCPTGDMTQFKCEMYKGISRREILATPIK